MAKIAGNDCKGLGLAGNGLKWLEMAGNGWSGWKLLEGLEMAGRG